LKILRSLPPELFFPLESSPSRRRGVFQQAPSLLLSAGPALGVLFALHLAFLLMHFLNLLPDHGTLAVPALCVALAESMVVFAVAVWGLRSITEGGATEPGHRRAQGWAAGLLTAWVVLLSLASYRFAAPAPERIDFEGPVDFEASEVLDRADLPVLSFYPGGDFDRAWRNDRPLVVVCCSGGGITAEAWTILMLTNLERALGPERVGHGRCFSDCVGVITGASGGMVGAAAWVGHLADPKRSEDEFRRSWQQDQLSRVVERMALWDFSLGLVFHAVPKLGVGPTDRGQLLENVWTGRGGHGQAVLPELGQKLSAFRAREEEGTLPSLIFSPVIANDGRRLLISNFDLTRLDYAGARVTGPDSVQTLVRTRSSLRLEWNPGEGEPDLATWARMSATFPFVTPTAALVPASPSKRPVFPVDAGYYDNFGTSLAVAWLRKYWLPAALDEPGDYPRTVILIELDAYPRFPAVTESGGGGSMLQDALRPLEALQRVRGVGMPIRSDEEVEAFTLEVERLRERSEPDQDLRFFAYRFTNAVDASLSWRLTEEEEKIMETWANAVCDDSVDPPIAGNSDDPGSDPQAERLRKILGASREEYGRLARTFSALAQ